jgi:NADP-dependent 3-hydroxy acid dehydrogenase YdfG
VVATELPTHITNQQTNAAINELYADATVTADDVAEIIAFVVQRPRHLAINEVLLRPATQA